MKKLLPLFLALSCLAQNNRPGPIVPQFVQDYPFQGVTISVSPGPIVVTNVTTVNLTMIVSPITIFNPQWIVSGVQPGSIAIASPHATNTDVSFGANGTYNLIARVKEGPRFVESPVTVVVNAVQNATPTISTVSGQTIQQDSHTSALAFTVGDVETPAGSLSVSATSSNTNLIDGTGIVLGGSGANRTVTLTPKALKNGTSTITLTVGDGGTPSLTATSSFLLTVLATNYPPTFTSVSNPQTSNEDVNFSFPTGIADQDTALANLTLTATTSASFISSLAVSGSGATRTVVVNLTPNGFGTNTVTLRLTDGQSIIQTNVTIQIVSQNDTPTITAIGPQQTTVGSSVTANFTIGDVEDGGNQTLSRSSDNLTVLPLSSIVFGGSGTNRTVTFTPQSAGTANVTITTTDSSSASASTPSFTVTGNAIPNTPPTITNPGPQTITD